MNISSEGFAKDIDEFAKSGAVKTECSEIACARVDNAPAALECQVRHIVPLEGAHNVMIIGEVVGVHMRDDCVVNGRFDVTQFQPITRMGYRDYAVISEVFELSRPDD